MVMKLITIIGNILRRIKSVWKRPKPSDFNSKLTMTGTNGSTKTFNQYKMPMVSANRKFRRKVKQDYGVTLNLIITKEEKRIWMWNIKHDEMKSRG